MRVTLDTRDVTVPPTFKHRLTLRVAGMLSRFARSVRKLHVSLRDINGPRGGNDKVCQITIALEGGDQIIVKEKSHRLVKAMRLAVRKAKVLLADRNRRRRSRRVTSRMLPVPAS